MYDTTTVFNYHTVVKHRAALTTTARQVELYSSSYTTVLCIMRYELYLSAGYSSQAAYPSFFIGTRSRT